MNKIVFYGAVLIGLFLVVVYYKGTASDINAGGGALGNLVLFLQGRNTSGQTANYPGTN